jgi:hypothetical protein
VISIQCSTAVTTGALDLHRGLCKDGKITRIDEYMDSSKFAAWAGRAS